MIIEVALKPRQQIQRGLSENTQSRDGFAVVRDEILRPDRVRGYRPFRMTTSEQTKMANVGKSQVETHLSTRLSNEFCLEIPADNRL
jgi:hypothetical protein